MRSKSKALGALLLLVLLFSGWYGRVGWNMAKPRVMSVVSAEAAGPLPSEYRPSENSFSYPRLGISAPLTERSDVSPLDVADWKTMEADLRKGLGLDYEGDSFSSVGHAFLVGHSSDTIPHAYSAIFAALGQAREGDTFRVVVSGTPYDYRVTGKKVVKPTDAASFAAPITQAKLTDSHLLSMVTCWPPLTTANRLVVLAERL